MVSLPVLARLGHVLYSPRHGPASRYNDDVFDLWMDVWVETLTDVGGQPPSCSDDFVLQDEICTLHDEGEPVGLVCFRWLDLGKRAHREIEFFQNFSYDAMTTLLEREHREVMVMNYLTVNRNWRRRKQGFGVSEVLIGLATRRFLETDATALVAYTRNDRRTHELVYRHGATPLATDRLVHGIDSHSVAIFRDDVQATTVPEVPGQVDRLWQETAAAYLRPDEGKGHAHANADPL